MAKTKLFLLLITIAFTSAAQVNEKLKLYVGTFTSEGADGIYLCDFNQETGDIRLSKTFRAIDNPSFLKTSPDDRFLYVATRPSNKIEPSGGYVSAYNIDKSGDLHFVNKQISEGADPCYVDVSADGKFVAVANYGGGSTALFPVGGNGSLLPASSVVKNQGSGPNKNRQAAPHAHSIKFSPYGKQVFSADLGTDQLNIFKLENSKLETCEPPFLELDPGAGPRHFAFHPERQIIYVINELNSTITSFAMKNNKWQKTRSVATLPTGFAGTSYCADIHISADGKYLYGSNRGHNSIAVFAVDDTGNLQNIGFVPVEGDWPRNFALSPNGGFLLVANQKSGNITVFKIDAKTGMPKYTGKSLNLPSPVCLEFL